MTADLPPKAGQVCFRSARHDPRRRHDPSARSADSPSTGYRSCLCSEPSSRPPLDGDAALRPGSARRFATRHLHRRRGSRGRNPRSSPLSRSGGRRPCSGPYCWGPGDACLEGPEHPSVPPRSERTMPRDGPLDTDRPRSAERTSCATAATARARWRRALTERGCLARVAGVLIVGMDGASQLRGLRWTGRTARKIRNAAESGKSVRP